ncbi:MAG: hypothetical protein M0Q38_03230 [Bacteroidales bacterium]|jgi:hypothetical protein|nr:hypothetical protein [Bacteroidales bacterium]
MSQKLIFTLLILLLPLLIFCGFYFHFRGAQVPEREKFASILFHDGDLVFRRGRSVESFAVYLADRNRDFSHIGLVVMDHGKPYVIHAVPGESGEKISLVSKEPIQRFLDGSKASHWAVYRSRFSISKLHLVAIKALEFCNRKTEFDNDYDLTTDSRLYCTELVLKAYQAAGIEPGKYPLSELRFVVGIKKILFPSAFIRSPDFFRVCSY